MKLPDHDVRSNRSLALWEEWKRDHPIAHWTGVIFGLTLGAGSAIGIFLDKTMSAPAKWILVPLCLFVIPVFMWGAVAGRISDLNWKDEDQETPPG